MPEENCCCTRVRRPTLEPYEHPEHALERFLAWKQWELAHHHPSSEVAFIAHDGRAWGMSVLELGPRTSLDEQLVWATNRYAKVLDADVVAYTGALTGDGFAVYVERRGSRSRVCYQLSTDGHWRRFETQDVDAFVVLPGGSAGTGRGWGTHDDLRIDALQLPLREDADPSRPAPDLDSAVTAYVRRLHARGLNAGELEYALFAKADEGWTSVIIRPGWAADFLSEVLWATNRIARLIGAAAASHAGRLSADSAREIIALERRGSPVYETWSLRDGVLERRWEPTADTFLFVPGGAREEGPAWANHDSISGPRFVDPHGEPS